MPSITTILYWYTLFISPLLLVFLLHQLHLIYHLHHLHHLADRNPPLNPQASPTNPNLSPEEFIQRQIIILESQILSNWPLDILIEYFCTTCSAANSPNGHESRDGAIGDLVSDLSYEEEAEEERSRIRIGVERNTRRAMTDERMVDEAWSTMRDGGEDEVVLRAKLRARTGDEDLVDLGDWEGDEE